MTSSQVELPAEVKPDAATLMASLHLMPTPVPNPEIKYTKVSARGQDKTCRAAERLRVLLRNNFFPLL